MTSKAKVDILRRRRQSRSRKVSAFKVATAILEKFETEQLNKEQLRKVMLDMKKNCAFANEIDNVRDRDVEFVYRLSGLRYLNTKKVVDVSNVEALKQSRGGNVRSVAEAISIWNATLEDHEYIESMFDKYHTEQNRKIDRESLKRFMQALCRESEEWPPTEDEVDQVINTAVEFTGTKYYRGTGDGSIHKEELIYALKEWYCSSKERPLVNTSCACVLS
eukprot:g2116.t1